MPLLISGPIIPVGKPLKSGRVYSEKILQKAIVDFEEKQKKNPVCGFFVDSEDELKKVTEPRHHVPDQITGAFEVQSLKLEEGFLVGTYQTFDTARGRMLEQAIRADRVAFRPQGEGVIDKDGKIRAYCITAVNAYDPRLL